jgi:N-acetylated-alpha-linked acidic dipeptidase
VAYLNVDSSASGPELKVSAVPSLNRLVSEAARDVLDITKDEREIITNRLGSGSDYTVFLNFLGVPIVDLSFTGPYGVYHSAYDNHLWVEKFGDPGFVRHAAMTRLWGAMALRLANADVVPFDYRASATEVRVFVKETNEAARAADRPLLRPLVAAADRLAAAADAAAARMDALLAADVPDRRAAASLGQALMNAERAFLDREGIPGRPWYRHLIYAPKPTYAAEVLPGVTEAIAAGDRKRLASQVARLVAALDRAAAVLSTAGTTR